MTIEQRIFENPNPNDPRTAGEQEIIDLFENSKCLKEWTLFEEPRFNGVKPDFIAFCENYGIVIIEVKDWDLSNPRYLDGGYIVGENGEKIDVNPIKQVEHYKSEILHYELRAAVDIHDQIDKKMYGMIHTMVYFHNATSERASSFVKSSCTKNYTKILVKDDLINLDKVRDDQEGKYPSSFFKNTYYKKSINALIKNLKTSLMPSDYEQSRRRPYQLINEQKQLAVLKPGSVRRWSGVAGSGKTIVLAEKAARALRENQRVLILTYNITLVHYIRDLVSQQMGSEQRERLRSHLTIQHFHRFLGNVYFHSFNKKCFSKNSGLSIEIMTKQAMEHISKRGNIDPYLADTILIDEGQDFNGEWVRFLKQFYSERGEFLVMYDTMQDIYQQGQWIVNPHEIHSIGFRGQPGMLPVSYRLPAPMIHFIERVKKIFKSPEEKIKLLDESLQPSFLGTIQVESHHSNTTLEELAKQVEKEYVALARRGVQDEDITILTLYEEAGLQIVNHFKEKFSGISLSHVYDEQNEVDFNKRYKNRQMNKWKFQGGTGRLKICSYHSFKGWESPYIILALYPSKNMGELDLQRMIKDSLLIGASRVKMREHDGDFAFICLNYVPGMQELLEPMNSF